MTASDVFFDTWAWWEVLFRTPAGQRLHKKYLQGGRRVGTSVLCMAEVSAKLHSAGLVGRVQRAMNHIETNSTVHQVAARQAQRAGEVRARLRNIEPRASLIDALILLAAQDAGATLISADGAYAGQPAVRKD